MNLRFWRRDAEQRNSFTDQVLAAQSSGWVTLSPKPLALAVVEACTGMIADPFLQAVVNAGGVRITPGLLYDLARDVLTTGNGVRLIEVNAGLVWTCFGQPPLRLQGTRHRRDAGGTCSPCRAPTLKAPYEPHTMPLYTSERQRWHLRRGPVARRGNQPACQPMPLQR